MKLKRSEDKTIYDAKGKFTIPYKGRLYVISFNKKILDN